MSGPAGEAAGEGFLDSRGGHRRVGKATKKRAMALCCLWTHDETVWCRGACGGSGTQKKASNPPSTTGHLLC